MFNNQWQINAAAAIAFLAVIVRAWFMETWALPVRVAIVHALCKQEQQTVSKQWLANNESRSKHNLRIAVNSDKDGHRSVKVHMT